MFLISQEKQRFVMPSDKKQTTIQGVGQKMYIKMLCAGFIFSGVCKVLSNLLITFFSKDNNKDNNKDKENKICIGAIIISALLFSISVFIFIWIPKAYILWFLFSTGYFIGSYEDKENKICTIVAIISALLFSISVFISIWIPEAYILWLLFSIGFLIGSYVFRHFSFYRFLVVVWVVFIYLSCSVD